MTNGASRSITAKAAANTRSAERASIDNGNVEKDSGSAVERAPLQGSRAAPGQPTGCGGDYPMLTGSVCIARKRSAKVSTLQIVAPIPAFMAVSKLELRRRYNAAFIALVFGGMSFGLSLERFMGAVCPDYGFGRCDGDHEKGDFRQARGCGKLSLRPAGRSDPDVRLRRDARGLRWRHFAKSWRRE